MEKITIHRALAELKTIGARIDKGIEEIIPSGVVQKDKLVNGVYNKEKFENSAKEKYQSITDLIQRRAKIKSAIVKANSATIVKVGDVQMTIADAINTKTNIQFEKKLIEILKKKHTNTKAALEKSNAAIDGNAMTIATTALGKQGIKIEDDAVQKVVGSYLENNKFAMVDPLDVDKEVERLSEKVIMFETQIDATLSEINATTFIDIE